MNASLRFCEWQEQIRAQYQPGLSQDLDGKCTEAILVTLMTLPKGKSFNWSTLAKRKNWYKKYGVSRLTRVRSGLVKAGEIGFDDESGSLGLVTIAGLKYLSTVTPMTSCAEEGRDRIA